MSRAFTWVMLIFAIGMLILQFGVAASPKIPVVILWVLVLVLCGYVLFFKKRKESAPK